VISFYATKTLSNVSSIDSWSKLINEAIVEDAKVGRLSKLYQKQLQVIGDGKTMFPKTAVANR
jgi:RecA/RadA recombinase